VNWAQEYCATLQRLVGFYNLNKKKRHELYQYLKRLRPYCESWIYNGVGGGDLERGGGQITVSTAPLMKHNTQWPTLLHPLLLHTLSLYTLTPLLAAFPTRDVATEHLQQHTRN